MTYKVCNRSFPTNFAWAAGHLRRIKNLTLTLLSLPYRLDPPTGGEGKNTEIEKKFPPPRRERAGVGIIDGNFLQVQEVRGIFRNFFLSLWVILSTLLGGCDYGRMNEQESIRTYETSLPEMPKGTIPVGTSSQVLQETRPENLRNPLPLSDETLQQGKDGYSYFCQMCHGVNADGKGTVGQSFAPLPTNLKDSYVQNQSDGVLFYRISFGYQRHPPLASTVSEEDRWAIIHYLRSLGKKGRG